MYVLKTEDKSHLLSIFLTDTAMPFAADQVPLFLAVLDEGSFSAAARKLDRGRNGFPHAPLAAAIVERGDDRHQSRLRIERGRNEADPGLPAGKGSLAASTPAQGPRAPADA